VILLHLALVQCFLPLALVFGPEPIAGDDFDTHIGQTYKVLEGLQGWGRSWVYDPKLLAGQPEGTIFDGDNKGWELWTFAGVSLGLSRELAFNSFVLATFLAWPGLAFLGARLLGFSAGAALLAAWFSSLGWFFDSFAHWCWWIGMVAYAFASYLCLLPLALFYRWLQDRRAWQAVAAGLTLGLVHLVHPYSFFILAAPMLALWIFHWRRLGARGHATVLAIAAATVAMNAWWLAIDLRFWHYILDSGFFGQSGLQFMLADMFGLLLDTATSGMIGTRTGFRVLYVAAAIVALVWWRRERDPRVVPFAAAMLTLAALSYLGAYAWIFRQIQPYRHTLPLGFVAIIPAAFLLEAAMRRGLLTGLGRPAKLALALLAIPAAQHLLADILYYGPKAVPRVAPLYNNAWIPITSQGFGEQPEYRHRAIDEFYDSVVDWVRAHDDGQSRFLVEEPPVGEQLTWRTDAQILGGFTYRNLAHSNANLFRRRKEGVASDAELRAYFETYAVSHMIITRPGKTWDRRTNVLEFVVQVGPHRIYRTKISPNLIAQGGGKVEASTNSLKVTGSDPTQDLVLRYHWIETLVCEPNCSLGRAPIDSFDPVGFINIPAPHPADLEVRNAYH
jgi:hypothetical protein